ncbi:MAG: hypothetical protein COY38_03780 [Candidatus Aenigmarchaeota archaeon CG_4_10_14_0_8_um_filter_37_24]|nr:hypothetical protein [Candidatus Aenigmarchaeota archaeon]OIN88224.1 MAG: hypothetical protein AUJ50_01510 [Candidatus Aenigmarchaeota archaeon CG1_02_38_14]PIV68668.1 MAG: hypothetical protein COS07_03255 [Candidatus Aenigmarchaeota archaeon CG01_land_8_20_14_3_00_37_9]PIW41180.1 MAG: hypothetical protein COW21_03315 [Candidatus Aenigmarchaeota archaeon CG15_BIG_FIL_POST_REV_8_21_14_020_37_27]PIX50810.1 MAG: hypothetical protein COZ52_02240 [Candidatus Aenigmarchaeota archaeon CG_4_8_14_3_u
MVTKIYYELEVLQEFIPDLRNCFHLRLLAKIIGTTHRTVSKSLDRLEKNGIVYHELKGKNKVYYLNLKNPLTKLYLIKTEIYRAIKFLLTNFLIQKLYSEIIVDLEQKPLILFGSFAKGEEKKESDIDLLIIGEDDGKIKKKIKEFGDMHNRKTHVYFIRKEDFLSGLKEKDSLILEIVKNHVILNNQAFFVDVLWGIANDIKA